MPKARKYRTVVLTGPRPSTAALQALMDGSAHEANVGLVYCFKSSYFSFFKGIINLSSNVIAEPVLHLSLPMTAYSDVQGLDNIAAGMMS